MTLFEKAGMIIFAAGAVGFILSIPDYNIMLVAGIIMVSGVVLFILRDTGQ